MGCETESKAIEKSIVARIVREPDLALLKPFEMDEEGTELDHEKTVQGENRSGGWREWN